MGRWALRMMAALCECPEEVEVLGCGIMCISDARHYAVSNGGD